MPVYSEIALATNLSVFVESVQAQHEAILLWQRGTSAPTIFLAQGLMWNRTDFPYTGGNADAIMRYNGTSWVFLFDPRHPQINAAGTVAFTAAQSMGNQRLMSLGAGTAAGDATRKDQQMLRDGSQAATAAIPMGGHRITGLGAPSADDDAARLQDAARTAFFETTSGERIDRVGGSGFPFSLGSPHANFINETLFLPEFAEISVRAKVRTGDDGDLADDEMYLHVRIPRPRWNSAAGGVAPPPLVVGWIFGDSEFGLPPTTATRPLGGIFVQATGSAI